MTSTDDAQVRFYVDCHNQDVYEISYPELGLASCVSSAHLIEERKIQLLRLGNSPANAS